MNINDLLAKLAAMLKTSKANLLAVAHAPIPNEVYDVDKINYTALDPVLAKLAAKAGYESVEEMLSAADAYEVPVNTKSRSSKALAEIEVGEVRLLGKYQYTIVLTDPEAKVVVGKVVLDQPDLPGYMTLSKYRYVAFAWPTV